MAVRDVWETLWRSVQTDKDAGSYGPGQQPNYGGPQAQSPAGYGAQPMGYTGPPSAGGYGRGQQGAANAQWSQPGPPSGNFNGFSGYQG